MTMGVQMGAESGQRGSTSGVVRKMPLSPGEAAPWFAAPVINGPGRFAFDTVGGRAVLMLFFGSAGHPVVYAALKQLLARRSLFDDQKACFFGLTVDPEDAAKSRVRSAIPGIRFVLDHNRSISRAFGALSDEETNEYRPHWLLLDPMLRVKAVFGLSDSAAALDAFEALATSPPNPDWAPVLMVENVLEPELCRQLIDLYDADGGRQSGFMRDIDGKTKEVVDPALKVRRDYLITDQAVARPINQRLIRRLSPMMRRAFQFNPTRIERLVVGCYESADGGHFEAHRDNTTRGTAHRKFAVTINLNADEYHGGDLTFPEFGPRAYRAPTGGAIVFSCSLLHRAQPVTRGRRFALLPFVYDEESAKLRERNAPFIEGEASRYKLNMDRAT